MGIDVLLQNPLDLILQSNEFLKGSLCILDLIRYSITTVIDHKDVADRVPELSTVIL
jgi:hypothetical protein